MRTRSTYTRDDFTRRTGKQAGVTSDPRAEKEPTTGTVRWVCAKVLRVDASGKRAACAQWAKLSAVGPRCADHWPPIVS
jgi:hypothetical protein